MTRVWAEWRKIGRRKGGREGGRFVRWSDDTADRAQGYSAREREEGAEPTRSVLLLCGRFVFLKDQDARQGPVGRELKSPEPWLAEDTAGGGRGRLNLRKRDGGESSRGC